MVTLYGAAWQTEPRAKEYCGASSEIKPTSNVENGSWFIEVDTGKNLDLINKIVYGFSNHKRRDKMITLERASYQTQKRYTEYCGLSEDQKPIEGINNGALVSLLY